MEALSEPHPTSTPRPAVPSSMRRRVRGGHGRGGVRAVIFPSIGPTSGDNVILVVGATIRTVGRPAYAGFDSACDIRSEKARMVSLAPSPAGGCGPRSAGASGTSTRCARPHGMGWRSPKQGFRSLITHLPLVWKHASRRYRRAPKMAVSRGPSTVVGAHHKPVGLHHLCGGHRAQSSCHT